MNTLYPGTLGTWITSINVFTNLSHFELWKKNLICPKQVFFFSVFTLKKKSQQIFAKKCKFGIWGWRNHLMNEYNHLFVPIESKQLRSIIRLLKPLEHHDFSILVYKQTNITRIYIIYRLVLDDCFCYWNSGWNSNWNSWRILMLSALLTKFHPDK